MPQISAELATLVGSRICHDLISPIGAISNGLELLDLAGSFKGPEHDLIAESVASANARIRFFRIAYGAAGEQMLGRAEVAGVLRDHGQTARLRMDWQPQDPQPRREVRLAFLALQCLETALPYGGEAQIGREGDSWAITGRGDCSGLDGALWDRLSASVPLGDLAPARVQFALLPVLAQDAGRRLTTTRDAEALSIRF
ncbi:MAG: histidine phosphotransferase [Pseudooceanicola sp.]|nr:histidine phosphotransferase [Pseudooceanicola sp.]